MAAEQLFLSLLGPFSLRTRSGQVVKGFESDKARGLLAYLVVEGQQSHRREALAGLLWGEKPERAARRSLSQALYNLRQLTSPLCDEILVVTSTTIQFAPHDQLHVDALMFRQSLQVVECHPHPYGVLCDDCRHQLIQAASLYRGQFLAGLSIADSPAYEEWLLFKREAFERQIIEILHSLADASRQRAELAKALEYLWRVLEIDPLREEAHRQVMALLALLGQRNEALKQYERCRELLREELGVEPDDATTMLYQQLLSGAHVMDSEQVHRNENSTWVQMGDGSWNLAQTVEIAARLAHIRGDYAAAVEHLENALRIYEENDEQRGIARVLTLMGIISRDQGNFGQAEALIKQARQINLRLGDKFSETQANIALGRLLFFLGEFEEATTLAVESLAVFQELGLRREVAYFTVGLGLHELLLARYDEARAKSQSGIQLAYAIQDQLTISFGMTVLGLTAIGQGQIAKAEQLLNQAVVLAREIGRPEELGAVLGGLGYIMVRKGDVARARQHIHDGLQCALSSHNYLAALLVLPVAACLLKTQGKDKLADDIYLLCAGFEFIRRSAHLTQLYAPYFADLHLETSRSIQQADDVESLWQAIETVDTTVFPALASKFS